MENIFNYANILNSYKRARRCKSHKSAVKRFDRNPLINILDIQTEILSGDYKPLPPTDFIIYEPKRRHVLAPRFRDRIVHDVLCVNVISIELEKYLIYDTYACRKGKGMHLALNNLDRKLRRHYLTHGSEGYFVVGDIASYFASINHEILKRNLYPRLRKYDSRIISILDKTIDNNSDVGLNLGYQTSQWYGNFYMGIFDHYVKDQLGIKSYIRYMDDWVAIVDSKEEARELMYKMKTFLREKLELETNRKTQIIKLTQGINFLGFHTYLKPKGKIVRRLKKSSIKGMSKKIKRYEVEYLAGIKTKDEIMQSYNSWKGHASHGDCKTLICKMDAKINKIFENEVIQNGSIIE